MGKLKRQRKKFHLSVKSKSIDNLSDVGKRSIQAVAPGKLSQSTENVFDGINISYDSLCKSLPNSPEYDAVSLVSTKSRKELKEEEQHLKKKEKQRLRSERFMRKFIEIQSKKKAKNKKKKSGVPVVLDMSLLADALPSLESLAVNRIKNQLAKANKKPKGILKVKQRQKQQAADVKLYKKILNDKTFKMNPSETITEYLKQKLANEH